MGITRFLRRRRWDEERALELAAYLAQEIDDNLARGMTPDQARTAAHLKLGNTTRIREEIYTMNSLGFIETLWQDLRYGARLLRRNPTFAVVAILTLALGTGANTAIFQLVDAVRLRTLPVDHPEQLAEVRIVKSPNGRTGSFMGRWPMLTYPLYLKIKEQQTVFSDVIAWGSTSLDLAQGGEQRPAQALWVSGNFFQVLGVRPAAGRLLASSDDVRGCGAPGVVLGYPFWQREYAGDPSAVGRTLLLDGHRFDIIGVTSSEFYGVDVGRGFDVAVPICAVPIVRGATSHDLERPDIWFLGGMGRLKPGVTLQQAGAHLAGLSKGILAATVSSRYSATDAKDYLEMEIGSRPAAGGISALRRNYGDSLNILLGVTGLVLLVACANLANLMLARATAREREVAVRLAIGASRRRIVRQMLSESLLIAAIGAGGGVLVAQWISRSLVAFLSTDDSPLFVDLGLDWRVFAFTAAVAVTACLLFGLAPAIRATGTSPGATMKAGSRGMTDGRERFGVRRALVVLQVALSLVLVVGALLFARSLRNLTALDPGFRQDGVLTASLDMRKANVAPDARAAMNARIIERVKGIPGVVAVAQSFTTPVGGNFWNNRILIGGAIQKEAVNFNAVGPGYFDALGMRLVAGRAFDARDTPQSPKAAIVTEAFVKKYFGGHDAIGQSFQVEEEVGRPRPFYQIVGVVKDTKYTDLREPFAPLAHLAATQDGDPGQSLQIVVRAETAMTGVTSAITRAVTEVNPTIAIQYQAVKTQVQQSLLRERLMATLSGFFGGLAVLIATIGLYGVMSYMVARRRIEIGVRMALGADGGAVVRMIVREAAVLLAAGLIIGAVLSVLAARTADTLLYGLKPWDPLTIALAMAGLAAVTLLASWVPARRASRLAPTVALREE
ncbi:MAG TPA: ABC transporter permease [Vicinamibacterales bacterium]|nr:ABC transporter permease [Vicinamibacterales bacterium]